MLDLSVGRDLSVVCGDFYVVMLHFCSILQYFCASVTFCLVPSFNMSRHGLDVTCRDVF